MAESKSLLVQRLLSRPEIHFQWEGDYRTIDNERFYDQAFDRIVGVLNPAAGATFLDAGCGPCAHSVRLARKGFNVHATDFSQSVLDMAHEYVGARGLADKITLGRENLMEFSFPAATFDYVLCWGVLMHIPEPRRAVVELARVLKPGGTLVISESNMASAEAVTMRNLKRLLRKEKAIVKKKPEGVESWMLSEGEALVTREANITWLVKSLEAEGMSLYRRMPGQFSEAYTRLSSPALKKLVHRFNRFWFARVKWAGPAFGNILFFRKQA